MFASLLIIYFVLFAILSWRHLDWAIYVIILALPTYLIRFEILGIPMTLLEGMILVLFAIWLIKKLPVTSYQLPVTNKYLIFPIGLFLLAATISIFTAPELSRAAGIWKAYFIEPVLFFIVFINIIKTKSQIRNVLWALGLSLLIPGVLAIVQKFTGIFIPNEFWQAESTRRVTSVYGFPNAIGLYFAPIITLLTGWLVTHTKTQKHKNTKTLFLLGLLIVVGLLSIIFAASKGAILAIGIGILFYALFWKGYRIKFLAILIASAIAVFVFFPSLISTQGASTVVGGGSLEVRIEQWGEAQAMLKTQPIFGAGLSGYQSAVAPFHTKDYIEIFLYPHQIVLNFWTEIGLLGLLAFIWLVVFFFKRGFSTLSFRPSEQSERVEKSQAHAWPAYAGDSSTSLGMTIVPIMAAMITLLSHGLVDVPYFKNDLSILFWILFGLIVVIIVQQNKKPKPV